MGVSEAEFPVLTNEVVSEAVVMFLFGERETCGFINPSARARNTVGPQHDRGVALADIDPSRTERDQPLDFGVLIAADRWCDVEVVPVLADLGNQRWAAP